MYPVTSLMSKTIYFAVIIFFIFVNTCLAQAPKMHWQKNYGGSEVDEGYSVVSLGIKKGYIVAGITRSVDGSAAGLLHYKKPLTYANNDGWVIKMDDTGKIIWQTCLGGTQRDDIYNCRATAEGGSILVGSAGSSDGDLEGIKSNTSETDGWIVKLDATGHIVWQKCLGGSANDYFYSIAVANDGYVAIGNTLSNDGNVSGKHGGAITPNIWVVKVDDTGKMQWQRCLGGTKGEYGSDVKVCKDSGYIIAGYATSNDGDVDSVKGQSDFWVVKLNSLGGIEWKKTYGGSKEDKAYGILQTKDGGYLVGGVSKSDDGDVTGHHGLTDWEDIWLLKLTSTGEISWEKSYGGTYIDDWVSMSQTLDGGYMFNASAWSTDDDVKGNHGGYDLWAVKLDSTGNIRWQKCLGGTNNDVSQGCNNVVQTLDSGYTLVGISQSNNGDLKKNNGYSDLWVVRLDNDTIKPTGGIYMLNTNNDIHIFPNPTNKIINVGMPESFENATIRVLDICGRQVEVIENGKGTRNRAIDVKMLAKGEYLVQVINKNFLNSYKIVKE